MCIVADKIWEASTVSEESLGFQLWMQEHAAYNG